MGRLTAPEIMLQSQGYPAKDQVTYFLIDKTAIPIKLHSMWNTSHCKLHIVSIMVSQLLMIL